MSKTNTVVGLCIICKREIYINDRVMGVKGSKYNGLLHLENCFNKLYELTDNLVGHYDYWVDISILPKK